MVCDRNDLDMVPREAIDNDQLLVGSRVKLRLAMETGVQSCSHFFPGNRLHLARIELSNPALDFFSPSGFNLCIGLTAQRLAADVRRAPPDPLPAARMLLGRAPSRHASWREL